MLKDRIAVFIFMDARNSTPLPVSDLGKFDKIYLSSRGEINNNIRQISAFHENAAYLPLDLDEIFQQAKMRHLEAMKEFRRWITAGQLKPLRRLWWLTQPSYRHHLFGPVFNLFLCRELQSLLLERHANARLECHLITDTQLADLVRWPIPTQVIISQDRRCSLVKMMIQDAVIFFGGWLRRLKRSILQRQPSLHTPPFDVTLVVRHNPACREKIGQRARDKYFADLPEHLIKAGLSVCRVSPPTTGYTAPEDADYVINWSLAGTCKAGILTLVFIISALIRIVAYRSVLKRNWQMKLLTFELLISNRILFGNIARMAACRRFFRGFKTEILLFYDESSLFGRTLQLTLDGLPQSLRPTSVGLQHGWVSENHLVYFTDTGEQNFSFPACDYYFAFNRTADECFQRFLPAPAAKNRIFITGYHRIQPAKLPNGSAVSKTLESIDRQKPIFLFISGILPPQEVIWQALITLMKKRPFQLIVKPHQAYPFPDKWFEPLNGSNFPVYYAEDFDLDQVISLSDYAIASISTALLNVVEHGKRPIVYLAHQRYDTYKMVSWFENQQDAAVVYSPESLTKEIRRLSAVKPDRPARFTNLEAFMPPFLGRASMGIMHRKLLQLLNRCQTNTQPRHGLSACLQPPGRDAISGAISGWPPIRTVTL